MRQSNGSVYDDKRERGKSKREKQYKVKRTICSYLLIL